LVRQTPQMRVLHAEFVLQLLSASLWCLDMSLSNHSTTSEILPLLFQPY
jgi:hypothetical protein